MTYDIEQRVAANRRRARLAAAGAGLVVLVAVPLVVVRSGGGAAAPAASSSSAAVPAEADAAGPGAGAVSAALTGPAGAAPAEAVADGVVPPPAAAPGADPAASPQGAVAPADAAFVAPARRVVLPRGAEQVNEYPVKFPNSPEGAVAAAVEMTRFSATLDFTTASEVLRLYAAPAHSADADATAAAAVEAARSRLGLPSTGPVSADASMVAKPIGVSWQVLTPDQVKASVESVVEYRAGDELIRELVSVNSFLQWDAAASDWKLQPTPADQFTGPGTGDLGTQAFNDSGWSAVSETTP